MLRVNSDKGIRNKKLYRYFASYKDIDVSVQATTQSEAQKRLSNALGVKIVIEHRE